MKLQYGVPKMDVVPFTAEDIIVTSMIDPTVPSTAPTEPSGLTNGGTGTGGSASYGDMFPGQGKN